MASFLLLTAISMSVWLLDSALRAEVENDRRIRAAAIAQNRLEEIRSYADSSFGTGLALFDGLDVPATEDPSLTVSTRAERKTLYMPCSELESQYSDTATFPAPEPKVLKRSVWQVEVSVSWSSRPGDRVQLVSYIGDWREPDFSVSISPSSAQTVNALATREFRASTRDSAGNPIDDLVYTWYVNPLDGMGSISEVSRDGRLCLYKNHFRNFDGSYSVQAGDCEVEVRAVFQGVERTARVRVTNNG